MTRTQKLKLNTITSLVYQIVSLVSGFILPRLILQYCGSEVNGLLSSITQFLAMITLCECGVGAVVQSALYKPIAQNDIDEISKIYVSAKKFFNRVAFILAIYIVVLIAIFPKLINDQYGYWFTGILIAAISISSFAQYYFGIVYKLIINSAQLVYIQMIVGTCAVIINVLLSALFMINGFSIQVVKVSTSIVFLLQPLTYWLVVRKRFNIDKKITYNEEPITQKWNGLYQHIATVVLENTDVIVLTSLSSLSNVSIYAVYHLVTNGIKLALVSLTTGMKSLLGDMYAREEVEKLNATFTSFEWIMHASVTFVYSVAAVLIVPFVIVYTSNIIDADYIQPVFGYILCFATMIYMIRIPYSYMILAAGHYKQTQTSALIEAGINIIVSVILVYKFGLIGVAVGTFVAMLYRTIYFVKYLTSNILYRKISIFVKHLITDMDLSQYLGHDL
ncbi:polysaccharide biosynthesis C-terminal domain-containing protein [Enterococcus faecium]|uniref:lipopolysaccharide biosynthesis protein n=1 Tax=Enterococcus faecium TaxID=1352 RepID=UPI0029534F6D|nr:polysaccharide biosynthesis C-terminal domain-containing protein [Enterococcus faecium]MDV7750959.1 polysaccharide biosynthesis C-terminal domain-containing protein [Enterococcus faecium]